MYFIDVNLKNQLGCGNNPNWNGMFIPTVLWEKNKLSPYHPNSGTEHRTIIRFFFHM